MGKAGGDKNQEAGEQVRICTLLLLTAVRRASCVCVCVCVWVEEAGDREIWNIWTCRFAAVQIDLSADNVETIMDGLVFFVFLATKLAREREFWVADQWPLVGLSPRPVALRWRSPRRRDDEPCRGTLTLQYQ